MRWKTGDDSVWLDHRLSVQAWAQFLTDPSLSRNELKSAWAVLLNKFNQENRPGIAYDRAAAALKMAANHQGLFVWRGIINMINWNGVHKDRWMDVVLGSIQIHQSFENRDEVHRLREQILFLKKDHPHFLASKDAEMFLVRVTMGLVESLRRPSPKNQLSEFEALNIFNALPWEHHQPSLLLLFLDQHSSISDNPKLFDAGLLKIDRDLCDVILMTSPVFYQKPEKFSKVWREEKFNDGLNYFLEHSFGVKSLEQFDWKLSHRSIFANLLEEFNAFLDAVPPQVGQSKELIKKSILLHDLHKDIEANIKGQYGLKENELLAIQEQLARLQKHVLTRELLDQSSGVHSDTRSSARKM